MHFVLLEGLPEVGGSVELVLVKRRNWWQSMKRLFGGGDTVILESVARVEPVDVEG